MSVDPRGFKRGVNDGHYPPPKRFGLLVHTILVLMLVGLSGWGIWNLTFAEVGPNFVIFLLDALLALVPVPLFVIPRLCFDARGLYP